MKFHLYKLSGYEEAIMSLRMSKGKFYSWDIALDIQDLVYVCTDRMGRLANKYVYEHKVAEMYSRVSLNSKVTGDYDMDIKEFKRLLQLTMDNAMKDFKHHTLMKYIDISFFTEGLHRGAQDDLDAHAIAFNNRITRFSTRLAEIEESKLSEWYQDKIISFHDAHHIIFNKAIQESYTEEDEELRDALQALREVSFEEDSGFHEGTMMPKEIALSGKNGASDIFKYTPFGYVLEKFADMSPKSGLRKDVVRGGMLIGMESNAIWKTDLFNLRYVYHMRSKLTKANPELRDGMEQLADQIESMLPVFGEKFRYVFTDTKQWEHTNRTRIVTKAEYEILEQLKEDGTIKL